MGLLDLVVYAIKGLTSVDMEDSLQQTVIDIMNLTRSLVTKNQTNQLLKHP